MPTPLGIPLPSELTAIRLANNQRRQQTRLISQSADYFDETGRSEAAQRDDALGIQAFDAETARGNMAIRGAEYHLNMSKENREQLNNLEEDAALVQMFIEQTGDMEGAEEMWNGIVKANEIPEDSPMATWNPRRLKAIANRR